MQRVFLFFAFFAWSSLASAQLAPEQHARLVDYVRDLSRRHIGYAETWRPPQSQDGWLMDCSNTARYLYWSLFRIKLPRTASDQYYELKQSNRVVYAPRNANGKVDTPALMAELRSGDLLFWEWTYDIQRDPPITHVMVYLGRTADGRPKMAGSASRAHGEVTTCGGVDVYDFDPNANMGGVKNFWGDYVRRAQFVGFGRPLAAGAAEPVMAYANNPPRALPVGSADLH